MEKEKIPIFAFMCHERHPSALQNLAAKWQLIGLVVVAFAKLIRRYEDGCRQGTYEPAVRLELTARAAHAMLMKDIAEALEDGALKTPEEENALLHLRNIAIALLVIVFVMQNILSRRLRPSARWLGQWYPAMAPRARLSGARSAAAFAILDPG